MTPELKHRNVVLVANQINPTIFQQPWMIKREILLDEEAKEFIQTPVFVQATTNSFELLVVSERVQIAFASEVSENQVSELTSTRLGNLVNALPETPYTAVGFNFNYHIEINRSDTPQITRDLFAGESSALSKIISNDRDMFGAFAITKTDHGELNLEVRPAMLENSNDRDVLVFKFNFNHDLKSFNDTKKIEQIHQTLSRWNDASSHAHQLIENFVSN